MTIDIGIKAVEIYFPNTCIDQKDLEKSDNCLGKYTIGLGQIKMGVCSDLEDINSIALTVTKKLLENNFIDPNGIGFLSVGTETLIDKSKSTKTVLMELFEKHGNTDIQGVDEKNACFGGTAALFAALDWLESSNCDGRLAIVVAADIAIYAEKAARCTGGAGAVAMLLGPNAPLVFDKGVRSHHMSNQWDFYKPKLDSEYPVYDGQLSIISYQKSIDKCFQLYKKKCLVKGIINQSMILFRDKYYFCFHSPYTKLVEKSFARLVYTDINDNPDIAGQFNEELEDIKPFLHLNVENTYGNRDFDLSILKFSDYLIKDKLRPGVLMAQNNGNMYTASLYGSLISVLIQTPIEELMGSRIVLFSYGSGLASCMFSLMITENKLKLSEIKDSLNKIVDNLKNRIILSIKEFDDFLDRRSSINCKCNVKPSTELSYLKSGTFYLSEIDEKYRRKYQIYNGDITNGFSDY